MIAWPRRVLNGGLAAAQKGVELFAVEFRKQKSRLAEANHPGNPFQNVPFAARGYAACNFPSESAGVVGPVPISVRVIFKVPWRTE